MLARIDSEYVTKYFGSYLKDSKIWIVMEYLAGGSCLDLVGAPLAARRGGGARRARTPTPLRR